MCCEALEAKVECGAAIRRMSIPYRPTMRNTISPLAWMDVSASNADLSNLLQQHKSFLSEITTRTTSLDSDILRRYEELHCVYWLAWLVHCSTVASILAGQADTVVPIGDTIGFLAEFADDLPTTEHCVLGGCGEPSVLAGICGHRRIRISSVGTMSQANS